MDSLLLLPSQEVVQTKCSRKCGKRLSHDEIELSQETLQRLLRAKGSLTLNFKTAQMSAGQQIDKRIDKIFACLDAKVKSIIKETVKSQYIKKESIAYNESLFEEESTYHGEQSQ